MKINELPLLSMWKVLMTDDSVYVEDTTKNRIKIDDEGMEFHHGDVIEINDIGNVNVLHDGSSEAGLIFITNQCNSNCIMCPDSVFSRTRKNEITREYLLKYIELLPSDLMHVDITGGEPTLLKYDLLDVLCAAVDHFEDADILMLSNGRSFASGKYTERFIQFKESRLKVEIPIHSATPYLHDKIAGCKGSLEQTMTGIGNLIKQGISVGIRIVVSKLNYRYLNEIIDLISERFPMITYINIMGLELLGSAFKNKKDVWIEFDEIKDSLNKVIEYAFLRGIEPRLYNYPLCMFDKKYWYCYKKSITSYKVRYFKECDQCSQKNACGGFFASTFHNTNFKVKIL